jgi:hypothetical protein
MQKISAIAFLLMLSACVQTASAQTLARMGPGSIQTQTVIHDPLYPEQVLAFRNIGMENLMTMPTKTRQRKLHTSSIINEMRVGFGFHDGGVDCFHPDLWQNLNLTHSRNFVGGKICDDSFQHGTYMAGVAASRNDIGIAGIWNGPFFMLSTVRPDFQNIPPEVQGGDYPVQMFLYTLTLPHDVVVLTDSTGGFNTDEKGGFARLRPTLQAIQEKTLVFFAASNWEGSGMSPDITTWPGNYAETHGCHYSDLPNVICVGSLDNDGRMSKFSYYGPKVTLGALGDNVLTTCPTNYCVAGTVPDPGYIHVGGTSIASSLAASATADATARFLEEFPEIALTPALIKRAVVEGSCFDPILLSSDPRTFALPARFCASGILNWLRRYANGTLKQVEIKAIQVAGASDSFTGSKTLQAGSWVSIYGSGFSENETVIPDFVWPSYTMAPDHIHVWCNGVEAPLGYVGPNQVNVSLPLQCYDGRPGTKNRLIIGRSNAFGEMNPAAVVIAAEGFTLLQSMQ